jgi:ribosomal protein S12 methylthiotransferase accessory factor
MQMEIARLSSSLRTRTAEDSIVLAEQLAMSRGVSRVVDTTWLDKVGIPVYASIRPDVVGTLCVHAGKGFTHAEAKIGALMEAIEFSFAVVGRSRISWVMGDAESVLESFENAFEFYEFGMLLGHSAKPDDKFGVVEAQEIMQPLGKVLVPAELVFMPFRESSSTALFGTSTNGLASGNSLEEATVHGLAEVMERHVSSFEYLKNESALVSPEGLPEKVKQMVGKVEAAGLQCYLRYSSNEFGMAYFSAYVLDKDEYSSISIANGSGFHPIAEIAAIRAVAEAVQSRLTCIHGGRDDLIQRFELMAMVGVDREYQSVRDYRKVVADHERAVSYKEIPDFSDQIGNLDDAKELMFEALRRAGMNHVVRVVFTESDYPFQVVRIVVPGAEMYEHRLQRVGPRLVGIFDND